MAGQGLPAHGDIIAGDSAVEPGKAYIPQAVNCLAKLHPEGRRKTLRPSVSNA